MSMLDIILKISKKRIARFILLTTKSFENMLVLLISYNSYKSP